MRFSAERLQRLAQIEQQHFWFVGRRALVARLMNEFFSGDTRLVLEAGCGTGGMLEPLRARGYRIVAFDMRPEGLAATAKTVPEALLLQADAVRLPLAAGVFDAALALDVLEHVDDRQALAEIARTLRADGQLILTVPALPSLWSYRDEAAGHLRRYTATELGAVLEAAGMEVRYLGYYQFILLPLVHLTRRLGRNSARWRDAEDLPRTSLNQALTWINLLEVGLGRWLRWPVGSSLVAVCRKRNDAP